MNTLADNGFNATLAQSKLVTKTDFDDKLSNLNRKITKNKTDHLLDDLHLLVRILEKMVRKII